MSISRRRQAASKYRPKRVRLLIVAEAPPCSPDRYFYYEQVGKHDWLFRYVWEALMLEKPDASKKGQCLAAFRDAGVFLVDLHEAEISKPSLKDLVPETPGLVRRCLALEPEHVVLVKATVYDAAYKAIRDAGLPVAEERIPFPSSGQQKRFLEGFRRATSRAGFEMPPPTHD